MASRPAVNPKYLRSGTYVDSDHPEVIRFSERVAGLPAESGMAGVEGMSAAEAREKAVAIYYAVRDEFRYEPYHIDLNPDAMKASSLLDRGFGFCIAKAVLMAAAARVQGIPARLGFADVRNHLTTERLRRSMGTDLFVYHGFAEILVGDAWVKATPAFNRSLCERFGVDTLEFDGIHDSVFQPFDNVGNQYMEYVRHHGSYADLPLEDLRMAFEEAYPQLMAGGVCHLAGRFEEDARSDRRRRSPRL
ncbi:MAG: transglutaminase family protein [Gemmatimonadota bacterium]|jgi:transglutaminase-like putative cysteine protease